MKDWQKGYELPQLLEIQDESFKIFNEKVLNPFLKMKKNRVADALSKNELFYQKTSGLHYTTLKVGGKISMYTGYKIPILQKKAEDIIIKRLSPSSGEQSEVEREKENKGLIEFIGSLTKKHNVYLYVIDECLKSHEIAHNCDFNLVGRQYNTFADVVSIYYNGKNRKRVKQPEAEYLTLSKLPDVNVSRFITPIQEILTDLENQKTIDFTNHYSNYNKKNTWSAISLRGYSSDWRFIGKPDEMSKKWKIENEGKNFSLQDTELMKHFDLEEPLEGNLIYNLLHFIGVKTQIHRIRFMKLRGGEGTLGRHTDQVCPDTGVADGKLMRLHFPIFTNPKVKFKSWYSRNYDEVVMKTGECWYLDARKPHEAKNGGKNDRIHLVIDVVANKEIRKMFE
jgi:hypothetical protein